MRPVLLVLALSALLLSVDFGGRMFVTNDEARFPLLARDVLEHGQWLVPRLNGAPHVDKPPLQAWLIAAASWPGGAVTQATAVVPSLAAALAVVLIAFWIARRLFGPDAATIAGLTTVSMYGVLTLGRAPMPDMTFCAALSGALAAYIAAELEGRRGWLIGFYAFVGLAVWAKGPAGLLPVAAALVDLILARGWSGPARLVSVPALAVLAALLIPWWALAIQAVGGQRFWIDVARNDWLLWYAPGGESSWRAIAGPFVQALTVLLPWSPLLPLAWWWTGRRPPAERRAARLLAVWFATSFALFALSHQQRMRYYLPLCPIAAILIAAWWSSQRWRGRAAAFAALWLVGAAGLSAWIIAADRRINAGSGLADIADAVRGNTATVYAIKVPELVFAYYLDRPVHLLMGGEDLRRRIADGGGYFIVDDRLVSAWPAPAAPRVIATGVVNRRPVSVFAAGSPGPVGGR